MELTYTKVGDYYLPDLALDDDTKYEIGIYGRMRQRFLEEHHPGVYNRMLLFGELWKHLAEIDAACHERMDFLIPTMAEREGVTEALKASNQMEWVRKIKTFGFFVPILRHFLPLGVPLCPVPVSCPL